MCVFHLLSQNNFSIFFHVDRLLIICLGLVLFAFLEKLMFVFYLKVPNVFPYVFLLWNLELLLCQAKEPEGEPIRCPHCAFEIDPRQLQRPGTRAPTSDCQARTSYFVG